MERFLKGLLVACLVLGLAGVSYGAVIDQFDAYAETASWGGSPPDWTVDSATNDCHAIQSGVVSGSYGPKALMMHNVGSSEGRVMWNQTINAENNLLRMYVKRDNTNQNFAVQIRSESNGGGSYVTATYFADNGYFKVHNGSAYVDYATYDTAWTWLQYEFDFPSNTYRAKLGDNAWTPSYGFMQGAFDQAGSVRFYTFSGSDRKLYVDRIELVPEPATLSLLGVGLAGLLGWRRRK